MSAATFRSSRFSSALWRAFLRNRNAIIGSAIVLLAVIVAILSPLLAPHAYDETNLLNAWGPPDNSFWLGTDELGRDTLSRLIVGARTSLLIAGSVVAITLSAGVALGAVAGYLGGWADRIIMRSVDVVLAFPEVVFAIVIAAAIGPGTTTVIVALSMVWWPGVARLSRSLVLTLRSESFIEAAVVAGVPTSIIIWRHLLPNMLSPILVRASVGVGFIIMSEATLSFLGLGVQEPVPSWGGMIREGLTALYTDPMLAISASLVLGVTIIGFNLLGDGLRDILDPKIEGR